MRGRTSSESLAAGGVGRTMTWGYGPNDAVTSMGYPDGQTLTYSYDAAGRQAWGCIANGACVAGGAQYSALDQPTARTAGNNVQTTWGYNNVLAQLDRITVGSAFDRGYSYDVIGNVWAINDYLNAANNQGFGYDARNRLTAWSLAGVNRTYSYDEIGNLTNKGGLALSYGATGTGTGVGPHQARTVGGQGYHYDATGNMDSGGGRSIAYDAEQRPAWLTSGGGGGTWNAQTGGLSHGCGRADADGWSVNTSQDAPGCAMQYGPYTNSVQAGGNVATWRLLIDNNSVNNAQVLALDVRDATTGTALAQRVLTRQEFRAAMTYQDFTLPYTLGVNEVGHTLEFRAIWLGGAYIREQQVRSAPGHESYAYDGDGGRVLRAHDGQMTFSMSGLWEEEIGGEQRAFYPFNGETVAMLKGGQYLFLHSDHLGSASLITNVNGQVVGQTEFDVWGKVRTGGQDATTRSFTGQELDTSGLLFYQARYYDPGIGRFLSADTVAPDKGNVQTRNRYSYALNNPLRYTDPTGHCAEGDKDDSTECTDAQTFLNSYGWSLDLSTWQLSELRAILKSIETLRIATGWSVEEYKNIMTAGGTKILNLIRGIGKSSSGGNPAVTVNSGSTIELTVYNDTFLSDDFALKTLVHEQAHVWDFSTDGQLSKDLMTETGGWNEQECEWIIFCHDKPKGYHPGGTTATTYGETNRFEDWAEAVTALAIPGYGRKMDAKREAYVRKYLPYAK